MWILRLAFRNALRNTRRSGLTALTVLLGTALLTVGVSWINGVFFSMLENVSAMIGEVRVVTPKFQEREALNPLYENMPQTDPLVASIQATGAQAYPVIRAGAIASVGDEIGEHFCLVVGADPEYFTKVLELDRAVESGAMPQPMGDKDVLLGRRVAEDLGAKVGDEIILLGQTQDGSMSPIKTQVAAVVSTGNALGDRQVFVTLEKARYMADIPEGALEILVYGSADLTAAGLLAKEVRALPELDGLVVEAWLERSPFNEILPLISAFMTILVGSIVFIAALGVLNTMLMSVLERTAEVGVMRAMGMSGPTAVSLFVIEAATIGLAGALPGATLGGIVATYMETHGLNLGDRVMKDVGMPVSSTLYANFSPNVALGAVALGVSMAVLGALLPSIRAAGIQPVDAMRSRR